MDKIKLCVALAMVLGATSGLLIASALAALAARLKFMAHSIRIRRQIDSEAQL
jgi:hypothetical protein